MKEYLRKEKTTVIIDEIGNQVKEITETDITLLSAKQRDDMVKAETDANTKMFVHVCNHEKNARDNKPCTLTEVKVVAVK